APSPLRWPESTTRCSGDATASGRPRVAAEWRWLAELELLTKLALTPNEDLRSRVTYSVLPPKLAPDGVAAFIRAELDRAELPHAVFTADALALVRTCL